MSKSLQNSILFATPAIIWGSTWYVIKFQIGEVNPLLSVAYRFFLAGLILLGFCLLTKKTLRYNFRAHFLFFLQGISLFGLNYWLVYLAEQYLTSGLIAVFFSLIVFANLIFSALFLGSKISWNAVLGGILAVGGTALIFKDEFYSLSENGLALKSVFMCLGSIILASLGNIASAYNQKKLLPVLQSNTFGMIYGSVTLFIISQILNIEIKFDFGSEYLLSLIYLALFGSIIAFSSYLKLLGGIGPEKSVYVIVIIPLIAMVFSTFFEDYVWKKSALLGMPLLLLGNMIAMDLLKMNKLLLKWK